MLIYSSPNTRTVAKLYTQKYAPTKSSDVPQQKAVKILKEFILTHKQQKKKAALIYGQAGTCKSSAVYAIANELNLEIIEVNASDFRNSEQLELTVGQASKQQSLFGTGKIILIDEVDGISGNKDRGGVPTLASIIAETKFPIVMTANDPWDSKFSMLRSKSVMIEFEPLDATTLFTTLKNVCDKEEISYDEVTLKTLCRRTGGDLRAALNDLHVLAADKKLTPEKLSQDLSRNKIETMFNALIKILKSTDVNLAASALDDVEEDINHALLWLDENVSKEYTNPTELARAYDMLSKADVFLGRIRRRQHWRFLSYANVLMTAGVAAAKTEKKNEFTKYAQPMRLLKIWQTNRKYAARKSIVEKLATETHTSTRKTLQSSLPFIQQTFQKNKEFATALSKTLKLEEEEVEWLRT